MSYEVSKQPFYFLLALFYNKGGLAVALFFSLSGFVFFWLYRQEIYQHTISARGFFILRFSRLYPLHFLMLIVVLIGQIISIKLTGCYMVYQNNDPYHFMLNLFFISAWGFEKGISFNGPIWSVSVEVFLYILFFILSKLGFLRSWIVPCILIAASNFIHFLPHLITQGIFSFFIGGTIYLFYERLIKRNAKRIVWFFAVLAISSWALTLLEFRFDTATMIFNKIPFLQTHHKIVELIPIYFPTMVLFPVTLLALALVETSRGKLGARISFIGDITYSSYLLHFPLQLVFLLVLSNFNVGKNIFYSIPFFLLFFLVLITLSFISYNYFERPLQKYIRRKFISKN